MEFQRPASFGTDAQTCPGCINCGPPIVVKADEGCGIICKDCQKQPLNGG